MKRWKKIISRFSGCPVKNGTTGSSIRAGAAFGMTNLFSMGVRCLATVCQLAVGLRDAMKARSPIRRRRRRRRRMLSPDLDANNFKVDHPEQFPMATAAEYKAAPALNVTGVVQPDISRAVPVISLAAGRVVEVKARLGDQVKKGQLLMKVQSNDVAGAYQNYRKAVNDELLARLNLERQKIVHEKGAVAKSALEQAEDVEKDAVAGLDAATEQMRLLGIDKYFLPSAIVDIRAPISGIITEQQVTAAAGVQGLGGAESVYDFRSFIRMDHLRCVRKRSGCGEGGRVCTDG